MTPATHRHAAPSRPSSVVTLPHLQPGLCGVVTAVDAADDDLHRLGAMGVCEGRRIELIKRGDPLIVRVYGSRVGLSARLAEMIELLPCPDPRCDAGEAP